MILKFILRRMNKYISNTIIFSILLFQVTFPCFTWAQGTSRCSDLQNNLPSEFAALDSDELRPLTIQLAGKFEQYQGLLTDARIDYYSQFSELYDCMVAEERWAPVAERGRFQSALDRVLSSPFKSPRLTRELTQTRMTREQIQKLPPAVIHSIWWDLADIQASWLTVEQLNYRLSQGHLSPPQMEYLTRSQVEGISQENVQSLYDSDIYYWQEWLTDEQLSWLSQKQLHALILNLR